MGRIAQLRRSFDDLPDMEIVDTGNAPDIFLSGFVTQIRKDTVRLIGYVKRGSIEVPMYDTTVIVHFPQTGFGRSMIAAVERWEEARGVKLH